MKYIECRGGFVKFHPPPQKRIYENVSKQFMELRGSWIFKHPPPVGKLGYDYTGTYRAAQRAALECQRGGTEVRDALHHCV